MLTGLSTSTLTVNNDVVAILPNTLVLKMGLGETKVRASSTGGGGVENVITEDVESKVSMVKFTLISTAGAVSLMRSWKRQANAVTISDDEFQGSFSDMSMITDPEIAIGADGNTEVEFQGSPMV